MAKRPGFSAKMQTEFRELEEICRHHGGSIISQPNTNPLKLVTRIGSVLPQILVNIGYDDIRNTGCDERLMPSAQGVTPQMVAVYEFYLLSDAPSSDEIRIPCI